MIYAVGNITKDVYLKLAERGLEGDGGVRWLDVAFGPGSDSGGCSLQYVRRASVQSGLAVSLECFRKFGAMMTPGAKMGAEVDYRYILCLEEDGCVSLEAQTRLATPWQEPSAVPKVIWVDYSARLSVQGRQDILGYLDEHKGVELWGFPGVDGGLTDEWRGRFRVDCETGWKEWKKKVENAKRVLPEDVLATITGAGYLAASMRGYEAEEALDLGILAASKARLDAVPSLEELTGGELKSIEETVAVPTRKVNVNKRIDHERSDIREVAEYLMTEGHGILAADESGGSIKKKFDAAGIVDDFQNRHDYRRVFLEAAGTEEYLTGVILFDETARDVADDGTPYPEYLAKKGIIPGVKVDQGLVDFGEEKVTKGLDGLDERLAEYRGMGCRFAKWRAAFEITKETPTPAAISANAKILAEYAASCQKNDIVPIVEPEVVYDGEYTLEDSARATVKILRELFKELAAAGVDLRAAILKTNMVLAGKKMKVQTPAEMVGKATALALRAAVPDELAGVVFLSGGQTPAQATENLHAIVENGPYNWGLTFSFARALQDPALDAWQGDNARVEEAREAFMARLAMVAGALRK